MCPVVRQLVEKRQPYPMRDEPESVECVDGYYYIRDTGLLGRGYIPLVCAVVGEYVDGQ